MSRVNFTELSLKEVKRIKKKKYGSHISKIKDYSNSSSDHHFLLICKEKSENGGKRLVNSLMHHFFFFFYIFFCYTRPPQFDKLLLERVKHTNV